MGVVLRFLATGDLQIHEWKQFAYTMPNGMNSRLHNCLKVFDIICREARKRKISKALINGDLFEETDYISVEVYDATYRKLERNHSEGLETAINIGNHDVSLQSGGRVLHSLRPFRKVARILEEPTRLWNHLQVVPWMANPKDLKKAISRLEPSEALVLHCGVQGARAGPNAYLVRNPIKLRDIRADDFRICLLSDYHTRQWLGPNVLYMGSPLQHSFGETHRPCIYAVSILDEAPWFKLEKIYTNLPRFRRVRVRTLEQFRHKIKVFTNDYVRAILPAVGGVSEADIEKIAAGRVQLQIERQGEDVEDVSHERVHAMRPRDAIERYVSAHASGGKAERLAKLGVKLFERQS